MIRTKMTDMFGIACPVVQNGMQDIPTCAQLVKRISEGAEAHITSRLVRWI
jgi:hypothetical protein